MLRILIVLNRFGTKKTNKTMKVIADCLSLFLLLERWQPVAPGRSPAEPGEPCAAGHSSR